MLDEKSSNTASVVVLCTAPDEATAQDLAAKVLAQKLAACATLLQLTFPVIERGSAGDQGRAGRQFFRQHFGG